MRPEPTTPLLDTADVADGLELVPPDELIDVLRQLHALIQPGGSLSVRASTDLTGARRVDGCPRFCAATYMTAFRRAGFAFGGLHRVLLEDDDPALVAARERMPFHDPLELRTVALNATLVRPDRVDIADLAVADGVARPGASEIATARRSWPSGSEKRSAEWGRRKGESLWENLYEPWVEDAEGRSFLDVGCSWGYLFEYMLDRCSPRRLVGVDVIPHWDGAPYDWRREARAPVELHRGDVFSAPLRGWSFDYILCAGVLQYLPPTQLDATLRRLRRLLRPGGELLLRTQTFTGLTGLQVHRACEQPYVHLLHGEEMLMDRIEGAGRRRPPYSSWLTASSYLSAFVDAGFEVRDARRSPGSQSPEARDRAIAEFPATREELCVDQLAARLSRPGWQR